ncbi:peptidoglycan-binding domain-containing protein [Calothrix sp. PCC 6303]|uniref:peptidoglycan-binding domain-containing protein n=1 Tax=Calothrix sp. PCC 6303 TaxID=1170562 RepID=UPI0005A28B54|nr:peptidoglycan-binding domain-containing protein [Calothrix sp. PCC 6303]
MSDLGLLMTDMLETRQELSPNLPNQPSIQQGKRAEDSIESENRGVFANFPITPPEFIPIHSQMDEKVASNSVRINFELQNVLREFNGKIQLDNLTHSLKQNASEPKLVALGIRKGTSVNSIQVSNRRFKSQNLPTLEFGNSGISVRVLQRLLVANGYTLRTDGFFGALTEAGVKAFQSNRNLETDGIVGEKTWKELTR